MQTTKAERMYRNGERGVAFRSGREEEGRFEETSEESSIDLLLKASSTKRQGGAEGRIGMTEYQAGGV